jgi:hypothetical protein
MVLQTPFVGVAEPSGLLMSPTHDSPDEQGLLWSHEALRATGTTHVFVLEWHRRLVPHTFSVQSSPDLGLGAQTPQTPP